MKNFAIRTVVLAMALGIGVSSFHAYAATDRKQIRLISSTGESTFAVPAEVKIISRSMLEFHVQYPTGKIFTLSTKPNKESIRVLVTATEREKMRSTFYVQKAAGLLEKKGDFLIFAEPLLSHQNDNRTSGETFLVYTDKSGQKAVIIEGLRTYRVYLPFSETIELDYQFSKEINLSEFAKLDALIVQVVNSLQVPAE